MKLWVWVLLSLLVLSGESRDRTTASNDVPPAPTRNYGNITFSEPPPPPHHDFSPAGWEVTAPRFTDPPVPTNVNPAGYDIRPRVSPRPPAPVNPPAPAAPSSAGRELPRRFQLPRYYVPTPYQAGTSQCWKYAMTGVLEYLKNQSECNRNPRVGGQGDLSERYMATIFDNADFRLSRMFTDGPLAARDQGYVLDRDARYEGTMRPYSDATVSDLKRRGRVRQDLPGFDREVLFSTPLQRWNDIFNAPRGIEGKDIEAMKAALLTYESPILFTYKPANRNYWHTNMIVGFNEQGFIMQDSAFGDRVPGTTDPSGHERRSTTIMSYRDVKASAKFAAVYHLNQEAHCSGDRGRQPQFAHLLRKGGGAKALDTGAEDPIVKGSVVTSSGLEL